MPQIGQRPDRRLGDAGHRAARRRPEPDGHRHGLVVVEQQRGQRRPGPEPVPAGSGYLTLQANQPSTIGIALSDSPAAQLAWIVEKFQAWTDPAKPLPEDAVDRDQLRTSVTATWLNGAGASSAQIIYESLNADIGWSAPGGDGSAEIREREGPTVPTAVAVFAADNSIRSRIDSGSITRWTEYDSGDHSPAMEIPDLLVADVRAFFAGLR